ncbi:MAG TPA: STAS domain-containing protein [Trebonia sp.]
MTDDASPACADPGRPAGSGAPAAIPPSPFKFLLAVAGEPAVLRATGDIDLTNVEEFQAALDEAAAASGAVTADLTAVTYCDSATIRALIITARRARLTIRVSATGPLSGTLFKVSGLDQIAAVVTLG